MLIESGKKLLSLPLPDGQVRGKGPPKATLERRAGQAGQWDSGRCAHPAAETLKGKDTIFLEGGLALFTESLRVVSMRRHNQLTMEIDSKESEHSS